jgi:RNA polymerase sigma factor (sigma-70 family)
MSDRRPSRHPSKDLANGVFGNFSRGLRSFLLRRAAHSQDVEDLAQEVYLRLLRVADPQTVRCPQAYLYRVALNVLHEFSMHMHSRRMVFDSDVVAEASDLFPDDSPGPEDLCLQSDRRLLLTRAIETLAPMQRTVLILAKFHDLSREEIATRLHIAPNTVKVHLYRAIAHCRELLDI